jgi:hypothetical protein
MQLANPPADDDNDAADKAVKDAAEDAEELPVALDAWLRTSRDSVSPPECTSRCEFMPRIQYFCRDSHKSDILIASYARIG